jgi:hypothetical protein
VPDDDPERLLMKQAGNAIPDRGSRAMGATVTIRSG